MEYTRFRIFLQSSRQTYGDINLAYREFQRSPDYQNINTPISSQLNIGRNNANFNVARHEQINNRPIRPLDTPLATRWSGNFPEQGQRPNVVLYRINNDGTITSYAQYDSRGMIVKRVDMTGSPHGGIPTPHVLEYGRSQLPNGTIRPNKPKKGMVRPARPDEIQYRK